MRVTEIILLDAVDLDSDQSAIQQLEQIYAYSVEATIASGGAITGTLSLQASNDKVNWVEIQNSAFVISSAGSTLWNITSSNYKWLKVVWVDSGSDSGGDLTAKFFARGF